LQVQETKSLAVVVYRENPILLDTVYTQEGKKIAYLVYNFFASDNNDGTMIYDKQLNDIFGRFKEEGVNELILDLRYNSGGSISSANALASMISNCTMQDVFSIEQYNDIVDAYFLEEYGGDYNTIPFMDYMIRTNSRGSAIEVTPIHHLGMQRLYVLTSYRTASASELVINALNPYLNNNIVLIGDTTVGKNVGSITIYEEDAVKRQTNQWGMQPIILQIANKIGFSDYLDGFPPDVEVDELEGIAENDLKPLGDTEEVMLKAALDHISGKITPARKSLKHGKPVGSFSDRVKARENMVKKLEVRY
jgi:C-terminal processing protease CtpA/Prc